MSSDRTYFQSATNDKMDGIPHHEETACEIIKCILVKICLRQDDTLFMISHAVSSWTLAFPSVKSAKDLTEISGFHEERAP